ncbi:hypothetical protein D3C77_489160 [compost metagenome]
MTIAERTQKNAPATGSVTAKLTRPGLPAGEFNATFFDVYKLNHELHIWAQQGDEESFEAIFLRIPCNTPDGEHPILPGDPGSERIRVHFIDQKAGTANGGPADNGKLSGFKWGNDKHSVTFNFEFSGIYRIEDKYTITGGGLTLEFGELSDLKDIKAGTGTVSATVDPAVFPNYELFKASNISFVPEGEGSGFHQLLAWQTIEGPEPSVQGVMLRISNTTPENYIGFFKRGQELLLANHDGLKGVEWNKEKRTFKANFEFTFLDGTHKVEAGEVNLSY